MPQIIVLAESGFGKTTSFIPNEKLGITGLNPKETFLITTTSKMLPLYRVTTADKLAEGNRVKTDDGPTIAKIVKSLAKSPYKNIIIDDINYVMQNFYMKNALKNGWDTPKQIGYNMGLIFDACEEASMAGKNIIIFGHPESYKVSNGGDISFRMKTTGNMTSEYITPEGKVDLLLFGKSIYNDDTKKADKFFVTEHDGQYPAKSQGLFDDLYIPNDMSIVIDKVNEYNNQ